jgi:hypothetical protein
MSPIRPHRAVVASCLISAAAYAADYTGAEPFGISLSTGDEANILPGAMIGCDDFGIPGFPCTAVSVSGQGATVNFHGGTVEGDLSWSGGTVAVHTFNFFGGTFVPGPSGGAEGSGPAVFTFHGALSSTAALDAPIVGVSRITGTLEDGSPLDYTIDATGTYTVHIVAPPPPAPTFAVAGTCPGSVTLTFAGFTPGGAVYLASAPTTGAQTLPPSHPCGPLDLGLAASVRLRATLTADAAGGASASFTVPAAACGQALRALDGASCALTDEVAYLP